MSIFMNCHSKMEEAQEDIKIKCFIPKKEIITLVQSVFSWTASNSLLTSVKTMMTCLAPDFTSKYKPPGRRVLVTDGSQTDWLLPILFVQCVELDYTSLSPHTYL